MMDVWTTDTEINMYDWSLRCAGTLRKAGPGVGPKAKRVVMSKSPLSLIPEIEEWIEGISDVLTYMVNCETYGHFESVKIN